MELTNTGKPKGIYTISYPWEDIRLEFINKTHRGQIIFRENSWVFDPALGTNRVQGHNITTWDPTISYKSGDTYVSYISAYADSLPEDNPFKYEYIYKCVENTVEGESPESHQSKWVRQGKLADVDNYTIFISDVLGLEEYLSTIVGASSTYTNPSPTDSAIGGISAGTTFNNKTMQEMWDMLLYPELSPALTSPYSSLQVTATSGGITAPASGFFEIGAVITQLVFTQQFYRGGITPAYGTSGYRSGIGYEVVTAVAGTPSTEEVTLDNGQVNVKVYSSINYTVVAGNQAFSGHIKYNAGEQPKTNKGNDAGSPLPAGQTSPAALTITGVYPVFATSVSTSVMTKQALSAHGQSKQTALAAESGINKQSVEIPVAWGTIVGVDQYNTLSGSWDAIALSSFTVTSISKTIQGNAVSYNKYIHNGPAIGARTLRWRT